MKVKHYTKHIYIFIVPVLSQGNSTVSKYNSKVKLHNILSVQKKDGIKQ